ncbi:MAG: maleylpyruvate isomerase N-terminal domain-containing protein [Chloroflexi bacterium]|nr:maleylpyruvate isomerase N-terminal domain-containing protein [Chloroflexota bacterium]
MLKRIDLKWNGFLQSYAGLTEAAMKEPGVVGDWSVKDILAHVTTWEDETLKSLPVLMEGRRMPLYGGVDRFNARQSALKRSLPLDRVLSQLGDTHQRLIAFLKTVPEEHLRTETRVRRRLRLDTYSHYPEHAGSIQQWRAARGI